MVEGKAGPKFALEGKSADRAYPEVAERLTTMSLERDRLHSNNLEAIPVLSLRICQLCVKVTCGC